MLALSALPRVPRWLQVLVGVNPGSHLTTATRGLVHATVTPARSASSSWCAALVAVFGPLILHCYRPTM